MSLPRDARDMIVGIRIGANQNAYRLAKKGDIYPIGDSQGTVNIDDQDWDLHVGYNGAMKVFSFVAPSEVTVFESDVKLFYDHVTSTQGFPADQQHLISMCSIALGSFRRKILTTL